MATIVAPLRGPQDDYEEYICEDNTSDDGISIAYIPPLSFDGTYLPPDDMSDGSPEDDTGGISSREVPLLLFVVTLLTS